MSGTLADLLKHNEMPAQVNNLDFRYFETSGDVGKRTAVEVRLQVDQQPRN
jgi:hypothetical protein